MISPHLFLLSALGVSRSASDKYDGVWIENLVYYNNVNVNMSQLVREPQKTLEMVMYKSCEVVRESGSTEVYVTFHCNKPGGGDTQIVMWSWAMPTLCPYLESSAVSQLARALFDLALARLQSHQTSVGFFSGSDYEAEIAVRKVLLESMSPMVSCVFSMCNDLLRFEEFWRGRLPVP